MKNFKRRILVVIIAIISIVVLLMMPVLGADLPFILMILFWYILPPIVLIFALYKLLIFIAHKTRSQPLVQNGHFSRKLLIFLGGLIVFNIPSILLFIFISNPGCNYGCPELVLILYVPLFVLILLSFFFAAVASIKISKKIESERFNDEN